MGKAQEDGTKSTKLCIPVTVSTAVAASQHGGVSKASSGKAPGTPSGGD